MNEAHSIHKCFSNLFHGKKCSTDHACALLSRFSQSMVALIMRMFETLAFIIALGNLCEHPPSAAKLPNAQHTQ